MRTFRLFLYLLSTVLFVTSVIFLSLSSDSDQYSDPDDRPEARRGFGGFLSFHNPGSLFGQAATISLTEDNSTFFAARPAAFGPLLPSKGLSGQIWVGGGFGDDNLKRRGIAAGVEGELGCNDIPGWDDHYWRLKDDSKSSQRGGDRSTKMSTTKADIKSSKSKRDKSSYATDQNSASRGEAPGQYDGTDEYLQHPLPSTTILRRSLGNVHKGKGGPTEHADIQSLQESAEIAGKIVILSRGGCGFSEKVKWAQRRGAKAVIIGDNILGGSLIRMYARGDTSNITIPSLFTSHMSAQLLSSLIPASHENDATSSTTLWRWPSTSALTPFRTNENQDNDQRASELEQTKTAPKQKSGNQISSYDESTPSSKDEDISNTPSRGWIKSSLSAVGLRAGDSHAVTRGNSRRPPSSGQLTWSKLTEHKGDGSSDSIDFDRSNPQYASKGFIIGVQDWRDPDVVDVGGKNYRVQSSSSTSALSRSTIRPESSSNVFKGGSITPGSGEYEKIKGPILSAIKPAVNKVSGPSETTGNTADTEGWFNVLAWADADDGDLKSVNYKKSSSNVQTQNGDKKDPTPALTKDQFKALPIDEVNIREGLWVTLTPSDMNASPFLNTLFVLVVSPLMTLAIVYSMLLLRSRIRRRRWRAPKSVVERLPVHTYHRLSPANPSSPANDGNQPSSTASTPLLPNSRPTDITSRPRSNTVCGPTASLPSSSRYGSMEPASTEQEKVSAGLTEWRRKYKGKQVECVVCLEEYVDGVSKVMSLPCGHEFHVDCITPWLTTRRRTCPICKGDVVRSMGRPNSRGRTAPMSEMTEEDVQVMTAETRNDAPSSAMPITQPEPEAYLDFDLERAQLRPASRQESPSPSWLSRSVSRGLGFLRAQSPDDHDHRRIA